MSDGQLLKFLFSGFPVRGAVVNLDEAWRVIRGHHLYPAQVEAWLGQALVTSALIQSGLKRPGLLSLQLRGGAALRMLLAQCNQQGEVRGLARFDEAVEQLVSLDQLGPQSSLSMQYQADRGGEPYQGIVPLEGEGIGEAVESYFRHSEQLPTRIWLAVNEDKAAGLLLQQLPGNDWMYQEHDEDGWNRVVHLAQTLHRRELLAIGPQQLTHRLFHQEQVEYFEPRPLRFACSCTRNRVADMLKTLGSREVNSVIAERGKVEVHCEHCNERYVFDAVDVGSLFHGEENPPPVSHRRQ